MPFPKNRRTQLVLSLAGVAVFLSLFILFPATTAFGEAIRGKSLGFGAFVLAFGLAVFIHELGHFLAAKAFKVPVERFVIGFDREAMGFMPRCIWERKIGETVYGLSLVPLGGYVKMSGVVHPDIEAYLEGKEPKAEEVSPAEEETVAAVPSEPKKVREESLTGQAMMDQAALYKKPFYQKVIIYSAGVIMNLLLAMMVLIFVQVHGETVPAPLPPVVSWQAPGSVIVENGIQQGDEIESLTAELLSSDGVAVASVADVPVETDQDYRNALGELFQKAESADDEATLLRAQLGLLRGDDSLVREVEVPLSDADDEVGNVVLGELLDITSTPAYIDMIVQDRPAARAGMERGDIITLVNGEPIDDWQELVYIIQNSTDETLNVVAQRQGREVSMQVVPEEGDGDLGQVGIWRGTPETIVRKTDLATAVGSAPGLIALNVQRYLQQLGKLGKALTRGEISKVRRDLGGPVAIARMAGHSARHGLEMYLKFLIMFNIALAVINILPIPILDGGHIVLAAFEGVFRRPVPPKVLIPVLNGAFVVLIALFILITFSDLSKWIFKT